MELFYLQMMFVVIAGIIGVIGGLAYHSIKIYFLIKKNIKNHQTRNR
jgi:hypothetical protein